MSVLVASPELSPASSMIEAARTIVALEGVLQGIIGNESADTGFDDDRRLAQALTRHLVVSGWVVGRPSS